MSTVQNNQSIFNPTEIIEFLTIPKNTKKPSGDGKTTNLYIGMNSHVNLKLNKGSTFTFNNIVILGVLDLEIQPKVDESDTKTQIIANKVLIVGKLILQKGMSIKHNAVFIFPSLRKYYQDMSRMFVTSQRQIGLIQEARILEEVLSKYSFEQLVSFLSIEPDTETPKFSGRNHDLIIGANTQQTLSLREKTTVCFRDIVVLGGVIFKCKDFSVKEEDLPTLKARNVFFVGKKMVNFIKIDCEYFCQVPNGTFWLEIAKHLSKDS